MIYARVPSERARSCIDMIFEISFCCGATLALLVNFIASFYYQWGWRLSLGAPGILAAFICLAAYTLVETPPLVESASRGVVAELLSARSRPILLINNMAVVCRQLAGLSILVFFGPFLLQSIGYTRGEAFLAPFVVSTIGTASTCCLAYYLRSIGRRMVLIIACIATFVAQVKSYLYLKIIIFSTDQKSKSI